MKMLVDPGREWKALNGNGCHEVWPIALGTAWKVLEVTEGFSGIGLFSFHSYSFIIACCTIKL